MSSTTLTPTTSAQVKAELRKTFPGVKFSVTSDRCLRVKWELGPTVAMVEAYVNKYQDCDFDGMQDMDNYRERTAENPGGWRYVFTDRSIPEELKARALVDLCTLEGVEPGPCGYNHSTRVRDEWASVQVHRAFYHVDFMGKNYHGIERAYEPGRSFQAVARSAAWEG